MHRIARICRKSAQRKRQNAHPTKQRREFHKNTFHGHTCFSRSNLCPHHDHTKCGQRHSQVSQKRLKKSIPPLQLKRVLKTHPLMLCLMPPQKPMPPLPPWRPSALTPRAPMGETRAPTAEDLGKLSADQLSRRIKPEDTEDDDAAARTRAFGLVSVTATAPMMIHDSDSDPEPEARDMSSCHMVALKSLGHVSPSSYDS